MRTASRLLLAASTSAVRSRICACNLSRCDFRLDCSPVSWSSAACWLAWSCCSDSRDLRAVSMFPVIVASSLRFAESCASSFGVEAARSRPGKRTVTEMAARLARRCWRLPASNWRRSVPPVGLPPAPVGRRRAPRRVRGSGRQSPDPLRPRPFAPWPDRAAAAGRLARATLTPAADLVPWVQTPQAAVRQWALQTVKTMATNSMTPRPALPERLRPGSRQATRNATSSFLPCVKTGR